jgi:hypothetical protein
MDYTCKPKGGKKHMPIKLWLPNFSLAKCDQTSPKSIQVTSSSSSQVNQLPSAPWTCLPSRLAKMLCLAGCCPKMTANNFQDQFLCEIYKKKFLKNCIAAIIYLLLLLLVFAGYGLVSNFALGQKIPKNNPDIMQLSLTPRCLFCHIFFWDSFRHRLIMIC